MKNDRVIGYQLNKKMFDEILNSRQTEADRKMNPYTYVMGVINEQFGLRGTVKHLSIVN